VRGVIDVRGCEPRHGRDRGRSPLRAEVWRLVDPSAEFAQNQHCGPSLPECRGKAGARGRPRRAAGRRPFDHLAYVDLGRCSHAIAEGRLRHRRAAGAWCFPRSCLQPSELQLAVQAAASSRPAPPWNRARATFLASFKARAGGRRNSAGSGHPLLTCIRLVPPSRSASSVRIAPECATRMRAGQLRQAPLQPA